MYLIQTSVKVTGNNSLEMFVLERVIKKQTDDEILCLHSHEQEGSISVH